MNKLSHAYIKTHYPKTYERFEVSRYYKQTRSLREDIFTFLDAEEDAYLNFSPVFGENWAQNGTYICYKIRGKEVAREPDTRRSITELKKTYFFSLLNKYEELLFEESMVVF